MLYTPMLPEAASGTLEPRHVVVPLRVMCPHAEPRSRPRDGSRRGARGRVAVETDDGAVELGYDQLVVALGAVSRTLPIPGLAEHALGFKSLADAIHLRNHVLRQLEAADTRPTARRARRRHLSLRLRRRGLRGRRGARRALRPRPGRAPLLPATPRDTRRAGISSTPRRGSSTRSRRGSASTRRASSRGRGVHIHARDDARRRSKPQRRDRSRTERGSTPRPSSGRRASSRNPLLAELGLPLDERGRIVVDADAPRRGPRQHLGARRLRPRPERRDARPPGPADLPARPPAGAAGSAENLARATTAALPLPHARPGRHARPLQGHRGRARACGCAASRAGS